MTNKSFWLSLAALAGVILVVYWPALNNGFVWDDVPNLVENQSFRGLGWRNLVWAFTAFHQGHYQPLTWLSFGIDFIIHGLDARSFHLTNILLHTVNTVLFALVCRRLVQSTRPLTGGQCSLDASFAGVVAATVFALHPMRVESVAWLTERRDVLCGSFFLLSIWLYLHGYDRDANRCRPRWLAASVIVFAASLLSKALGLALPLVLLIIDVYPLHRLSRSPGESMAPVFRRMIAEKLPYFILSIASGLVALAAQSQAGALIDLQSHDPTSRMAQASFGALYYLRAMFHRSWYPLYERPEHLEPFTQPYVVSAVLVMIITLLLIAARRRAPALLAAWACYLVLLGPVLGVAQSGVQLVADRYSYLANMSWALVLGAGLACLAARSMSIRALSAATCIALCATWATWSWQQTRIWHDDETFWNAVLDGGPSALAHNNLGAIAVQQGDIDQAMSQFSQSLDVNHSYGRARSNLVSAIVQSQSSATRPKSEALKHAAASLERSLDSAPQCADCWYALGLTHGALGQLEEAGKNFSKAFECAPTSSKILLALADVQAKSGDSAAEQTLKQATGISPRSVNAWLALARYEYGIGNISAARDALTKAREINPNHPDVVAAAALLDVPTTNPALTPTSKP